MSANNDLFPCVRVEGAILPADLLQRVAAGDKGLAGLRPEDYHLVGEKVNEATSHAWTKLSRVWEEFRPNLDRPASPADESLTLKRWLLPFWNVLGYGQLDAAGPLEIDGKPYPISHVRYHSPVHLVGFRQDLDRRVETGEGKRPSPHGMVQELLNRSQAHLWAFVSNGLKLRVLRDNIRLTRQAFVEFDLQAMFDGKAYADFALLWRLCHESRVKPEKSGPDGAVASDNPADCWLERWSKAAAELGLRALEQLRVGVERAIEALGRGFLHPRNAELIRWLREREPHAQEYYRQLLRVVYRLLFLFVAEDRGLLFDPSASEEVRERYGKFYSSARLRRIAERTRGTPHTDLYHALELVLHPLGRGGCPELGLTELSGLFDPAGTANLAGCVVGNADLLEAVRALSIVSDGKSQRSVDYRNLGSEELGSVYESLLELKPQFTAEPASFELKSAAGNERKTTGSYYTPTSLITCLLDSALDPVLEEAAKKPEAEAAILNLKVCDPAVGSGHFLIAAAHRIARKLAAVRTQEEEPAPDAVRHALRDVIGRCVYGVDVNPMAVELCQVALWMEAMEPGKPLSFLKHRIQCGNALLGVTPTLLAKGIPDEAFEPIEGDDKAYCREWKKTNKREREDTRSGQRTLEDFLPRLGNFAAEMAALDTLPDDTPEQVRAKAERYERLASESGYRTSGRFFADVWCAAFVWRKARGAFDFPITERIFRRVETNPHAVEPWIYDEVVRLREQYRFFHWHLTFPGVFRPPTKGGRPDNELAGWCGGFDVVLGNPPWEKLQTEEQQFFATLRPDIAGLSGSRRKAAIAKLDTDAPRLAELWKGQRRFDAGTVGYLRQSGAYPLSAVGKFNSYALFVELNRRLLATQGRVGCIVPSGLATDDTTKSLFSDMVTGGSLVSLFDLENRQGIFQGVHRSYKFCLLSLTGSKQRNEAQATFCFYALSVEELRDPDRRFTLTADDIRLLNPNTLTCPTFRSRMEAELAKRIYRRLPVLHDESNQRPSGYAVQVWRLFNTTDDSDSFVSQPDSHDPRLVAVTEAKTIHQYDHRFATYRATSDGVEAVEVTAEGKSDPTYLSKARYYVTDAVFRDRLPDGLRSRGWFLTLRNIARATDERTIISSVIPRSASCEVTPYIEGAGGIESAVPLLGAFNTYIFDYCARQKVGGTHVSYFILYQLPVLALDDYCKPAPWCSIARSLSDWLLPRVVELTYTAWDLQPFAIDCGFDGPPFRWDESRRFQIRCELDAAFFHLYLGTGDWKQAAGEPDADFARLKEAFPTPRHAVEYVMDTFPIVEQHDLAAHGRYRTKECVVEVYDHMATEAFVSPLEPEPGVREEDAPTYGPNLDLFGELLDRPTGEQIVIRAYEQVREGSSDEYVVCDPDHERRLHECVHEQAPWLLPVNINMTLWNARRSRKLKYLPPSRHYSPPKGLADYEFVCEWAYRSVISGLVREGYSPKHTTLERFLCNPEWRQKFDALVVTLHPEFSLLDYRMLAMRIRKRSGVKRVGSPSLFDRTMAVSEAGANLPDLPGHFLIRTDSNKPLYTGYAANLREQANRLVNVGKGAILPAGLLEGFDPAAWFSFASARIGDTDPFSTWRANLKAECPVLNLMAEEV